jgi:hypothetical protein
MNASKPHLLGLLAGLFLAAGLVLSAMVVTRAWLKITQSQTIAVTGSAKRAVVSDLIVWRGSYGVERPTLREAQAALREVQAKLDAFLARQQITNATHSAINIEELKASQKNADGFVLQITSGYRLSQIVTVKSTNVQAVLAMDGATRALVEDGVIFTQSSPEFIYTRANEAKIEMLAEATRDARLRADQIAKQGDSQVAQLRSARMGVFQITPEHSADTSWEGLYDTSTLNKTITAVVSATFALK